MKYYQHNVPKYQLLGYHITEVLTCKQPFNTVAKLELI